MALPQLPDDFHDACLVRVASGPRNEVTLTLDLTDPCHPKQRVHLRFGGMTNFSDVCTYFERIPRPTSPDVYLAQIDHLGYAPHAPSHTHSLIFELDVDGFGSVLIRCRNIAIRTNEQTEFTFL